jgi:hypothetical protein
LLKLQRKPNKKLINCQKDKAYLVYLIQQASCCI